MKIDLTDLNLRTKFFSIFVGMNNYEFQYTYQLKCKLVHCRKIKHLR